MIALPSQPQPPSTQTPYHTTCGLIGMYVGVESHVSVPFPLLAWVRFSFVVYLPRPLFEFFPFYVFQR